METNITNYKNYVITTTEGVERGLFFRSFIQKAFFDAYLDRPKFSAWDYKEKLKNPIRRIYEILIGNKEVVKNINKWSDEIGWGGVYINIICFPIYFKRVYRKLTAISTNADDNIQSIDSYGYESEFDSCGGNCICEKTLVILKNKKRLKFNRKEQYHFTYCHIIKNVIEDGFTKEDIRK